jgi:hypothetical protein
MSRKHREPDELDSNNVAPVQELEALEIPAAAVAPTTIPAVTVAPIKEYVALRVFATIAGPKWDQMAGFVSYARRQKLGPLTMEDWRAEFKKFQGKPTG